MIAQPAASTAHRIAEPSAPLSCFAVGSGIVGVLGVDQEHANRIAGRLGEVVPPPWQTLSFFDEDGAHLGLLVHGWTGPGGMVSVSFEDHGLRLTRALVVHLYRTFFEACAALEVVTRVAVADPHHRRMLRRLGFEHHGIEYPVGLPARLVLRATPDTLPAWFARWRRRHVH